MFSEHINMIYYMNLSCCQAVRYLAECPANREKMKDELGMMLSLQNVMQKSVAYSMYSLQQFLYCGLPSKYH